MEDLTSLELHRQRLEENVTKLRTALRHWKTWDAEYEGLKEELLALGENPSAEKIEQLCEGFGGELVNEREIRDLLGFARGRARSSTASVNRIERRQDYVQQNIATLSTQLLSAEVLLDNALDGESSPTNASQGLPISEIIEELDEDGNVISGRISQPATESEQIAETLRKAGLVEVDSAKGSLVDLNSASERTSKGEDIDITLPSSAEPIPPSPPVAADDRKKSVSFAEDTKPAADPPAKSAPKLKRKSVSFASTAKQSPGPIRPDVSNAIPEVTRGSFATNDKVLELNDDDEVVGVNYVSPPNESPEDARLRREMLQYSLNEVGSVVAEMDIDDTYSDDDDWSDDLEVQDDEAAAYSDMSEEEDEHGRATRKVITPAYRKQMRDLEERLKASVIQNLGPEPDATDQEEHDIDPDELKRIVVQRPPADSTVSSLAKTAPLPGPAQTSTHVKQAPLNIPPAEAPLNDVVRERTTSVPTTQPSQARKPSRFKQARQTTISEPPPESNQPTPPKPDASESSHVLTDMVKERPTSQAANTPLDEDTLDSEAQRRELASTYYALRNNIIRQQGGFKSPQDEEEEEGPLMEEANGKVRKVSRFKAARMKH